MLFTNFFIDEVADQMLSDSLTFGTGIAGKIALIGNDFTPAADLLYTDLTFLSGNGLSAKALGAGSTQKIWNSDLGVWGFLLDEPTGGFNFVLTAVPDPVPTVYGYAYYNTDPTNQLLATAKFTTPVIMDTVGKAILLSAKVGELAAPFIGGNEIVEADVG